MNMLNELQTMSATKVRVLGLTFGTGLALALIGSYEYGKRTTRKLYEGRINELEIEKMNLMKVYGTVVGDLLNVDALAPLDNTNAEDEVAEPGVSDQGNSHVSVIPHFTVPGRKVVTQISDDITSAVYTSPGITLEDAERLINGEMAMSDDTRFPIPEGGLWAAGYMIGGNDEDREIHNKAVQAAKGVKPKRESKKDRIAREKREAQEMKEIE